MAEQYKCQECGRKFRTIKSAERAASSGCPGCGSVDIDVDTDAGEPSVASRAKRIRSSGPVDAAPMGWIMEAPLVGHSMADHDAIAYGSPEWLALSYLDVMHVEAGADPITEPAYTLELRNCSCHSTLSRKVPSR